jgi:hypothetical protein
MTKTTTMGQLVCELYARFERQLRDPELAAVATQVRLAELLEPSPRARRAHPLWRR